LIVKSPLLVAIASGGRLDDRRSRSVDESCRGRKIRLTQLKTNELAQGYRTQSLKLKPVVNEERDGRRINDFIFGKDGNIYAILAVSDFAGLVGQPVAIPYCIKLDDSLRRP
jgi:hypothetical protein